MKTFFRLDFSKDIDFTSALFLVCYLNGEKIIFTKYSKYFGPITMQYLPNGGIQSLFDNFLIIKINNGFLKVEELIFNEKKLTSKDFIKIFGEENLINQVLE